MNKSPIAPTRNERPPPERRSTAFQQPRQSAQAGSPIKRWLDRFAQLEWSDRLNLILAGLLGSILIASLSPILLVLWTYQVARNGAGLADDAKVKPPRS